MQLVLRIVDFIMHCYDFLQFVKYFLQFELLGIEGRIFDGS